MSRFSFFVWNVCAFSPYFLISTIFSGVLPFPFFLSPVSLLSLAVRRLPLAANHISGAWRLESLSSFLLPFKDTGVLAGVCLVSLGYFFDGLAPSVTHLLGIFLFGIPPVPPLRRPVDAVRQLIVLSFPKVYTPWVDIALSSRFPRAQY